jgi:hypothetical protein
MPLNQDSLKAIAEAVRLLLQTLESTKGLLPAQWPETLPSLIGQEDRLRSLLSNGNQFHPDYGNPEIDNADLRRPVRIKLRELWELIHSPMWGWQAIVLHRDETTEFLAELLALLEAEHVSDILDLDQIALTPADLAILTVLAREPGRAVFVSQLEQETTRLRRDQRGQGSAQPIVKVSDRTARKRVEILRTHQLVARPDGTRRKGVAITKAGLQALQQATKERR